MYCSKYMYKHLLSGEKENSSRKSQLLPSRSLFSISDRKKLQRCAQENPYPQLFQIREIAKLLNTTVKRVKNWFRMYRWANKGFLNG